MSSLALFMIVLGALFLVGTLVNSVGQKTHIPRVTLLMLLGLLVSSEGLDLLPAAAADWFHPITVIALVMVGFLLGERFTLDKLQSHGREVMWLSLGASVGTSVVVTALLVLLAVPFTAAVLLGGIAAATDPAALADVVAEDNRGGPFVDKLLSVVALDDAWGLIVFSLCASIALLSNGNGYVAAVMGAATWEIGGAFVLGIGLGLPAALLTGRLEPGQPTRVEALGVVMLCGGFSLWLEVSFLITAMTTGAVIANVASHHDRPFHEIEGLEGPFLVLFFPLAGASLELASLDAVGLLLLFYVASRLIGKVAGGYLGGLLGGSDLATRRWAGIALTPQAGVAIGMALIAIERFPGCADVLLPTVIAATVFFELIGPILTRVAMSRVPDS